MKTLVWLHNLRSLNRYFEQFLGSLLLGLLFPFKVRTVTFLIPKFLMGKLLQYLPNGRFLILSLAIFSDFQIKPNLVLHQQTFSVLKIALNQVFA